MNISQTITQEDYLKQNSRASFIINIFLLIISPIVLIGLSLFIKLELMYFALIFFTNMAMNIYFALYLIKYIKNNIKNKFKGQNEIKIYLELTNDGLKGEYFEDLHIKFNEIKNISKTSKHFVISFKEEKRQNIILNINPSTTLFIERLKSKIKAF